MKKHEISQWFTQHVAEIIAEGFAPCMDELTGSYSDVYGSQMVFAKGNERVIMWMAKSYGYGELPVVEIARNVARITLADGESLDRTYYWSSDWREHITATSSVHEVTETWYTESREEAEEAERKRLERFEASFVSEAHALTVTSRLVKAVRRMSGFKSIRIRDLMVLRVRSGYVVKNTRTMSQRVISM